MLVTTKQILKRLPDNLKLTSILQEAVTNSIQAKATKIEINFDTIPSSLFEDKRTVKTMSITDNGVGFTDKNIDSFNHYLSDYKQQLGCKGIGRFTFLTLCDKVVYTSFNNDKKMEFTFSPEVEMIKPIYHAESNTEQKTIATFYNIQNRDVDSDLKSERKNIINHFLSIFKFMVDNKEQVLIKLLLDGKHISSIDSSEHGSGFKDDVFEIDDQKFVISYKQKGSSIKGFYCADKRSVKRDSLEINFMTQKDKGLLFFVSSNFFNSHVNDERDDFTIKANNNSLFDESLDWDTINRKLFTKVDGICKSIGIDIEEKTKQNRNESLKTAPYLASYIEKSQNRANTAEIIKEAKELFAKDKEYIRNIRNKRNSDYEQRLHTSNQAELAEYIFDREKIILDIQSDLDNIDKKTNETIIHNKIMKKSTGNINYKSYKDNNLWLFDERFMIYNYAHSDETINKILDLNDTDKNIRPDICIFTKSENELKEIIIIELKGSDATGEKNASGINELNKYTRKIKDHFEKNGEEVLIWSYLITSLNKETKDELENMSGIKKTYTTKGDMYYLYNEKLNAITHILTLETMIEDALSRNQLFLDILRGDYA